MARNYRKGSERSGELDLQITSLADILIIVLVFLLKSFSMDHDVELDVPNDIRLPTSQAHGKALPGVRIEISEKEVRIAGKAVVGLENYRFPKQDLKNDFENSSSSHSVAKALRREKPNLPKKERLAPKAWILAHRLVPYRTIQTIMASAALEGFGDFKLAVIKERE